MSNFPDLTELEDAILRYVQDQNPTIDDIVSDFTSGTYSKATVKDYIHDLEKSRSYIKLSDEPVMKAGIYNVDQEITADDTEYVYEITALGKAYLARSTANFTSFSNITNSNIAHQSPGAYQTVNISEQPADIQEKYRELQLAIKKKDSTTIKEAFGYIADKSVDVAIAIATGMLLR